MVVFENSSEIGAFPALILRESIIATASAARRRRMTELPPTIRRNWAASSPQWCAISRLVGCHKVSSLEAMVVGPGTQRWSLRSFPNSSRLHIAYSNMQNPHASTI
ncbi:nucleotide-binding protein [Abeliophyllum distichum]|uniref:Nucleotide-binding protein n=1 Tax=Abeliophyllum distichum TaxID=126358 RepID=A0ABD1SGP9_9LAMI